MPDLIVNSFALAVVFVTSLVMISLAVGSILVAGISARDYFRTRRAQPVDWYDVSLLETLHRVIASNPMHRSGGRHGQVVVLDAVEVADESYVQEELPF